MRITGGILCGRTLNVPGHGVRPTQDRVRAALFSSLGNDLTGARVLDIFAGSGALGLEAWSRGAAHVTWVEKDPRIHAVLKKNVQTLCSGEGGTTECLCMDAQTYFRRCQTSEPYDLILADPPYDAAQQKNQLEKTLIEMGKNIILKSFGLIVYEQSASEPAVQRTGWLLLRDKKYGSTRLLIYRKQAADEKQERND